MTFCSPRIIEMILSWSVNVERGEGNQELENQGPEIGAHQRHGRVRRLPLAVALASFLALGLLSSLFLRVTLALPSFTLEKTAPASVAAGDPFTYQIKLTNTSGEDAIGVVLTDRLPSGVAACGGLHLRWWRQPKRRHRLGRRHLQEHTDYADFSGAGHTSRDGRQCRLSSFVRHGTCLGRFCVHAGVSRRPRPRPGCGQPHDASRRRR